MAKSVSKQIADIEQDIMSIISCYALPQSVNFKLGAIYANLEKARQTATDQEEAYTGMMQMYLAKNPKKLGNLLQNISDIISGNNLCKEEENNNG
jgi:hypothetical protein